MSRHKQRPRFKAGVPEISDQDVEKALRPSGLVAFLRAIAEVVLGGLS
jgi:hypothetical protein